MNKHKFLFLCIVILVCISLQSYTVFGYNAFENAIGYDNSKEFIEEKSEYLCRSDCLNFIMLGIGLKVYTLPKSDQEQYYIIYDITNSNRRADGGPGLEFFRVLYETDTLFFMIDPIYYAIKYAGIAKGEYRCGYNNEYVYFNFFRPVTFEEVCAFMVRCLEYDITKSKTVGETFQIAKDTGLIKESDKFFDTPEEPVTLDEFKVIFNRFLDCPRGLYHEPSDIGYDIYIWDENGEKTYREMLIEYYTEGFDIYDYMDKSGYAFKEYSRYNG